MNRYRLYQRRQARKELLAAMPLIVISVLLFGALVLSVLNSISPL